MGIAALDDLQSQEPVLATTLAIFGPWYPASAKMRSINAKDRRAVRFVIGAGALSERLSVASSGALCLSGGNRIGAR